MYAEQETNVLVKPHSRAGIKIFDGQKSDYERYANVVELSVLQECGQEGYDYLYCYEDEANQHRWDILPVPDSYDDVSYLVDDDGHRTKVTYQMKRERRDERAAIRAGNRDIEKLRTSLFKIQSIPVNLQLQMKFKEFVGSPHSVLKFMRETYGPTSLGPQDIGYAFLALIELKMAHHELFSNFIIVFEMKKRYVGLDDVLALALLQAEGDGQYKVCVIPQRLLFAVRFTKADKMDYETTKAYLTQQDMLQHSRGLAPLPRIAKVLTDDPTKSTIQRVTKSGESTKEVPEVSVPPKSSTKEVLCYFCYEHGHTAPTCAVRAKVIALAIAEPISKKVSKKAPSSSESDDYESDAETDSSTDYHTAKKHLGRISARD